MRTSTLLGAAVLVSALGALAASAASTSARPLARDGKIAFQRNFGQIFVVNPDGSGAARLRSVSRVHRDTRWYQPSWSPDGKRLALIGVFDNGTLDKDIRIYVRDANGGTKVVTVLQPTGTSDISWSPGGKQLASDSGGDDPVIFTVRVATGKLTGPGDETTWVDGDDPDWSPDGAWICYQSSVGGLALVRPDGQGKTLLTSSGFEPDWSPDGKRIVFGDLDGIFVVDRDGSHLKRLTTTTRAGDSSPDWSPSGSRIVFSRLTTGSRLGGVVPTDLWVMRPDGSHQVRLVKNGGEPSWQPLR